VSIHKKRAILKEGNEEEIICEAIGSRPAAILTWWLDNLQIHPKIENVQIVSWMILSKIYRL